MVVVVQIIVTDGGGCDDSDRVKIVTLLMWLFADITACPMQVKRQF